MEWNLNATSSCRISTSTSILQSALGEIKEYPPTSLNTVYYIRLERKRSIYDSNISHHQYRTILVLSNFHSPSNLQKLPFRLAVRMWCSAWTFFWLLVKLSVTSCPCHPGLFRVAVIRISGVGVLEFTLHIMANSPIVGTLAIEHSVDPNGSLNLKVPITVPPAKLSPDILVSYHSAAQEMSVLGHGWEIQAFGLIERTPATIAQDRFAGTSRLLSSPHHVDI